MANGNDNGNVPSPEELRRAEALLAAKKEDLEVSKQRLATEESITNQNKVQQALNDVAIAEARKKLLTEELTSAEYEKQIRLIAELRGKNEDLSEQIVKANKLRGDATEFAKGFGEMLGLAASYEETIIGKLSTRLTLLAEGGDYAKDFTKQLKKTLTVSNFISSIFDKIVESTAAVAIMYDQSAASFNKLTGEGGRYNELIGDMATGNLQFGIGVTENAASMGALYTNMAAFTNESAETQKQLTGLVSKLDKLGVDAGTSSEILNTFTKGLGMSSTAAATLLDDITNLDIGVSTQQIAQNISAATDIFIRFGDVVGKQVFTELSLQSKNLGIAMSDLISITQGLNTFDSAATMAGQLNAVLGGNLINSVELLTATDAERVAMLRESFLQTGRNFGAMSQHEKQMFANIATQGDLSKASKLFTVQSAEQIAKEREKEERLAAVNSVMEKLNFLMQSFAIASQPFVDRLSSIITSITKFVQENKQAVAIVTLFVGILGFAYLAVLALSAIMPVLSLFMAPVGAGAAAAGGGIAALGAGAASAVPGVAAFGVAMIKVGIGVALIGAGIYLATTGFAKMFSVLSKAAEGGILTEVIIGLTAITGLLLAAAGIAMFVGPGFFALAGGIAAIGLALKLISSSDLIALGLFSSGLGRLATGNVSGVTQAMVSLKEAFVAANTAGDDTINRATALVKAMSAQNAATSAAAFSNAAPSGVQSSSGRTANNNNGTTVILKINNKEFGRAVLNSLEREMNLSVT